MCTTQKLGTIEQIREFLEGTVGRVAHAFGGDPGVAPVCKTAELRATDTDFTVV